MFLNWMAGMIPARTKPVHHAKLWHGNSREKGRTGDHSLIVVRENLLHSSAFQLLHELLRDNTDNENQDS